MEASTVVSLRRWRAAVFADKTPDIIAYPTDRVEAARMWHRSTAI
jgi:hypothetical protein